MTNFDFLLEEDQFQHFAKTAVLAESFFTMDYATCVINCRKAMELCVKWIYSIDEGFDKPIDDTIYTLLSTNDFRDLVSKDMMDRLHFIRKIGNSSIHSNMNITEDAATLCLENLYVFMDFVAYCYSDNYTDTSFNKELLKKEEKVAEISMSDEISFEKLYETNIDVKEELSKRREKNISSYNPKPLEYSEFKTRKIYIDIMLCDSGWVEGEDWQNELKIEGMPNESGDGHIDYVLYDDNNKPLAIIEAKKTCKDEVEGRHQAKLYADVLEKEYNYRPIIFLTNGFDTRIVDGQYPERQVTGFYSKRDLQKLFNLRNSKGDLNNIEINEDIAGRYYQKAAIKAVCDTFGNKNRRNALLVMATGSGKTRTVIELSNILINNSYIKNVLFLADRTSLIEQAKRNFTNLLPNIPVSNMLGKKRNYSANIIFSTYQTMTNCIDEVKDEKGRIFTNGHFDLIICDEAHRSIYNKYKELFNHFDALLVGLTATPKDEIDKNTYDIFELEKGIPTYGYELAQAVKDGYLVDFKTVETKLKFLINGIVYDDLSEEEKEEYEDKFIDEDDNIPESVAASAINKWIYNENTIKEALNILMTNGLKVDYNSKIGKTIIFAKNHNHAKKIYEVFGKEYPNLKDYAKVIDNYQNYAQSLIDEFSESNKLPQIAISVDMLDTGIDVPEILNLVFFKNVMSKSKLWQMIGRGTRLCEGLIDGKDKKEFYIFDFCGNFEFFRINKGKESNIGKSLQSRIFYLKLQMIYKLQSSVHGNEYLMNFRNELVDDLVFKIQELNKENFMVKQHLKFVEKYSDKNSFNHIEYEETLLIDKELSSLIHPYDGEVTAVGFDALLYAIELAHIDGKDDKRSKNDLLKKVRYISEISNIPEIIKKKDLIDSILNTDLINRAGINDFEKIREGIRELIKYIDKKNVIYDTYFIDDVLSIEWNDSEIENSDLDNYKKKAEIYIRENQDKDVIKKLKTNKPLTKDDIEELELILWSEVGTKSEYEKEFGEKSIGEFVREIVGLDMKAAKEAFSEYLNDNSLDSNQIYFIDQIIEYIVQNGMLKDLSVLQGSPFTDKGSVVDVFNNKTVWLGIKNIIMNINDNVMV